MSRPNFSTLLEFSIAVTRPKNNRAPEGNFSWRSVLLVKFYIDFVTAVEIEVSCVVVSCADWRVCVDNEICRGSIIIKVSKTISSGTGALKRLTIIVMNC